jgi:NAD(P)-dependent dehydrogenase (short-subunit alcohol dehydrogenase family)
VSGTTTGGVLAGRRAVVYLASPAADGVNGQSLVVDGGIVMS